MYRSHGLMSLSITWGAEFRVGAGFYIGASGPAPSATAAASLDCAIDT
ncbi:hypothetical protein PC129_g19085 [Phytophthora cactorum]|uniref:Uncharacterized protein n=1 Tax=Phytophthora cactorum TaxID=29920 RepID=A0A8T1HC01_9STRA|nr:hypothetical protein Pcac1_g26730 [Phytophthora cactorum]KAG2887970.1 hypothetical protein PC114_g18600 [Phytophthora cactorum]KAG3142500.1 hypothetical protein C6341_g19412 [Phytophthora cactorum]KAG3209914.1 hypothetical protein PC129_g19085 [Phytophthora cactorum]KAG4037219.1 hypothetical protein PC123_g27215 [Phytophthora cactorum]